MLSVNTQIAPAPTTYADNQNNRLIFEIGNHDTILAELSAKYKRVESPKMVVAGIRDSQIVRIQETANLVQDLPRDLFVWPTASTAITQFFRNRHTGIDISNSQRVEVYASADGIVESAGYQGGYGNAIVIDHQNGYKTLYGHLSRFNVEEGQEIKQHAVIGWQGNTGTTRGVTGIHLHFEIIKNGVKVNPLGYIKVP